MFGPLAQLGNGAGFSGSSSAESATGAVHFGAHNFAPKASSLPPVAWIALGLVALVILVKVVR
jgi:hypothetical protein